MTTTWVSFKQIKADVAIEQVILRAPAGTFVSRPGVFSTPS